MKTTARLFSFTACFALFNISVPFGAVAVFGIPVREKVEQTLKDRAAEIKRHVVSKPVFELEQKKIFGRTGECPYLAGQNKWDVMYKGVNLMTGNYSSSTTDLSFDGGFGIPVNITRSYSANDANEGPFGKGWEMSADVRNTAGGLLKSSKAPIRSIPVTMKERNSQESDPNVATQPPAAVTATDASGHVETVQKDVDGVLTTPPWDSNVSNPTYAFVTLGGSSYQVQTGNVTTSMDGTAYTYAAEGSYPNGTLPWNASQITPAPTPQAANVLKVTSVVDRQGNVTTYAYNQSTWVNFAKIDGTTQEHPLSSVAMPNGHVITFGWQNFNLGNGVTASRIVTASDGTRTVNYGYTSGLLTSVTTPGGKTSYYACGSASVPNGWNGDTATNLLTSMMNPQGLITNITYQMADVEVMPYFVVTGEGVTVIGETAPNGNYISFLYFQQGVNNGGTPPMINSFTEYNNASQSSLINAGLLQLVVPGSSSPYLDIQMKNPLAVSPNSYGDKFTIYWEKDYDPNSQNLMVDAEGSITPYIGPAAAYEHDLAGYGAAISWSVTTTNTYNFANNPLEKTVVEHTNANQGYTAPPDVTYDCSYAYWDATKYYQQKATQSDDTLGETNLRWTYTDYYPSSAPAGSRGQQYQVYDPSHGGIYLNTNATIPGYANPNGKDNWKYQITPGTGDCSAQFAYDAVGRCTDVYKLQKSTSNPYTYVHTQTTYGANNSPNWGQATQVVEDSGGINRTTKTLAYTAWGKPSQVLDAAGHQFVTSFDLDGNVQSVTRTDSGMNQTVAQYTYGSAGTSPIATYPSTWTKYGLPTSIQDGLSGVTDSITYDNITSDGGYGQVSSTLETNGASNYGVLYTYNVTGDRQTSTYQVNGSTVANWGYYDYIRVGSPESGKRAFQTLNKLTNAGATTSEELHYAYDSSGALYCAAFANTPQSGQTGYSTEPAQSRCRVVYNRDPGGRILSATHWWDTLSGSTYSSEAILDDECNYEVGTGLNRGLKLGSSFYKNTAKGSANWTLDHTESYSYDPKLDYLTGANYGDGLPNPTPSWAYDAAGNRTDTVADNVNRPTTVGGVSSTSDILGNRLTLGSKTYGWDSLNRMTSYGTTNSYVYRADGMRVSKVAGSTSTVYRYDGQMGLEDVDTTSGVTTTTDYGLGARGVDYIASAKSGTTTVGFPIYDCHGNMTACLFRSGTNYYSLGNQRHYDAWGMVRSGATTGDPKGRYCASLGHKQDDESGLVYMRARYYEPSSGRFVSEDSDHAGVNLFFYASNNPVCRTDRSGSDDLTDAQLLQLLVDLTWCLQFSPEAKLIAEGGLAFCQNWLLGEFIALPKGLADPQILRAEVWISTIQTETESSTPGFGSIAQRATSEAEAYSIMVQLVLWVTGNPDY